MRPLLIPNAFLIKMSQACVHYTFPNQISQNASQLETLGIS